MQYLFIIFFYLINLFFFQTYVANILLAINPYKELRGLYNPDTMKKYNGKSLGVVPPHVFAIGIKIKKRVRLGQNLKFDFR